MKNRGLDKILTVLLGMTAITSCAPKVPMPPRIIPAELYARNLRGQAQNKNAETPPGEQAQVPDVRQVELNDEADPRARLFLLDEEKKDEAGDAAALSEGEPEFTEYRSSAPDKRDYNGPLSLGDPGMSASLWRESRGGSELVRDYRAWAPMDLVTIIVSESSEGKKEADTDLSRESSITAAISNLLGFEDDAKDKNNDLDLENLINAETTSDFKAEGETTRKDELTAKISAMVVEVLPSGILRVEGQKIIAVNNEEQTMVISGLVRPTDVTSENEVNSSKVANMRIDYFGRGSVGEVQREGWGTKVIRAIWPF